MSAVHPDDVAGVKAWFETLAAHVREVDFAGARPIFAPDMIAFGTFTDFMTGREAAEQQQWRNIWPAIQPWWTQTTAGYIREDIERLRHDSEATYHAQAAAGRASARKRRTNAPSGPIDHSKHNGMREGDRDAE